MLRSLLSVLEEVTLLVLPHGGQRTARRNAWRAATDLHVTTGYRWVDATGPSSVAPVSGSVATTAATAAVTTAASLVRAPVPRVVAARS